MQGTLEKSRIEDNEMIVPNVITMPSPPEFLNGYAIEFWNKVTNQLFEIGMLHDVDLELLVAYCMEMGVYYEMAEILKAGRTEKIYNQKGILLGSRARPEVKIQRDSLMNATKLAIQFGFTPSARASLSMPEQPESDELEL